MGKILRTYPPGTPVRQVANIREHNFMAEVLNDLQGVNCRVEKPTGNGGRGWRIVVDGLSDVDPGADLPDFSNIDTRTPDFWVTKTEDLHLSIAPGYYRSSSSAAVAQSITEWDVTATGWIYAVWDYSNNAWDTTTDSDSNSTIIHMATSLPSEATVKTVVPIQRFTVTSSVIDALPPQTHSGWLQIPYPRFGA